MKKMHTEKCCVHCPGKLVSKRNDSHECCLPKYVSGNLRVPPPTRHASPESDGREIQVDSKSLAEDRSSCYDRFALAKRLHEENLEHKPLPDRVDDSVFKNLETCRGVPPGRCSCWQREPEHCGRSLRKRYGPVLGCKEPETKMDLAICWETPLDPSYEPRRPNHVDGSEGGLAPAIFALVQHTSNSRTSIRSAPAGHGQVCQGRRTVQDKSDRCRRVVKEESRRGLCCDCLCKGFNEVDVSSKTEDRKRNASLGKCVVCEPRNLREDPRLVKSAVGLALGLEKQEYQRKDHKTVVNGYRGTDYPEHWRLMTVYQQSYKNPYRRSNYH